MHPAPAPTEPSVAHPYITVDPTSRYGAPTLRGILTVDIADAHWLGFNAESQFQITRHDFLVACWYEGRYGDYRLRWLNWAMYVAPALETPGATGCIPVPPTRTSPVTSSTWE